jgi:hypothetical protein
VATVVLGNTRTSSAAQTSVTAIDIRLEPDATLIQRAAAANARLLKNLPKGLALDATHCPGITVLQRYVRTADLDRVYAAAGNILVKEDPARWTLKAFKYYYIPGGIIGLGGIVIEPTADLLRLQQHLVNAIAPFTVETGTAAAFVTTPEEPDINPLLIDYITTFVPEHTGSKYSPHVTIGIGTKACLKAMSAEPFEVFTFSPAGASVYHLGNNGTARTKLQTLTWKP